MLLTLGGYLIKLDEWASASEMTNVLGKCNLGNIELYKGLYSGQANYTLLISSLQGKFGIGIGVDNVGNRPSILIDYFRLNVIIGFGQVIKIVSIRERRVIGENNLEYNFYQFHSLYHIDVNDFFLVQSEVAIAAFTYQGKQIWNYVGEDIIDTVEVSGIRIVLKFLYLPSPIYLKLMDGTPIK